MTEPLSAQGSSAATVLSAPSGRPVRRFTGYHMTAILVTFFGVVIAVNLLMANLAISTFGGEVVENSYVASQHFNRWLDSAKADRALGWKADFTRDVTGAVSVDLRDANGNPLTQARVSAVAEHPLGLRDDEKVVLHETVPGRYAAALPAGRWRLRLQVSAKGQTWHTIGDLP
ncbi:FixH family protein [Novosphingobium sp. FKTRR1]|uniref:FixH family protein n=1 Tax=Novosphingobium sp. FKTRR1 TaxID=2879118 RepID=UPI001CEFFE92|nr:FixH family protein [Novosphingobium sp. FKTRR1]